MHVVDTLIVGGGLAGLSLAESLANSKHADNDILVLERYAPWGGRVATYRDKARGFQYEIGAGRIFHAHKRVGALVERFGLHTFPINTEQTFNGHVNPFQPLFEPVRQLLESIPQEQLQLHTIEELVPKELREVFQYYPYWAEIHMLRADLALPLFAPKATMAAHSTTKADYYGVVEGLDSITTHLKESAEKAGAVLKHRYKVTDIRRIADDLFEITGLKGKKAVAKPFKYHARRVIVATCRCEWDDFTVLKDMPFLKQLSTSALLRIYAVYPTPWFDDIKMVTNNPIRYIIPIQKEKGLVMISYTDGKDTEHWRALEGKALEDELQAQLHIIFPDRTIPNPTYLQKHDWKGGCTYWLPGDYDPKDASKFAQNPSTNVYVCGESVSMTQTWMEGALESSEYVAHLIKNQTPK